MKRLHGEDICGYKYCKGDMCNGITHQSEVKESSNIADLRIDKAVSNNPGFNPDGYREKIKSELAMIAMDYSKQFLKTQTNDWKTSEDVQGFYLECVARLLNSDNPFRFIPPSPEFKQTKAAWLACLSEQKFNTLTHARKSSIEINMTSLNAYNQSENEDSLEDSIHFKQDQDSLEEIMELNALKYATNKAFTSFAKNYCKGWDTQEAALQCVYMDRIFNNRHIGKFKNDKQGKKIPNKNYNTPNTRITRTKMIENASSTNDSAQRNKLGYKELNPKFVQKFYDKVKKYNFAQKVMQYKEQYYKNEV